MTTEFPVKKIRLLDTPFILALGGTKVASDAKMMFIDKTTGVHYTIRLINDKKNGRFIVDIHLTDEKVPIDMSRARKDQDRYKSGTKIKFILDITSLNKDGQQIGESLRVIAEESTTPVENDTMFAWKAIIPMLKNFEAPYFSSQGKEATVNGKSLAALIEQIKSVSDLDRFGFNVAIVKDGRIGGAVFKKEGKWYYFDMTGFAKKGILLFEPYITIEGVSKEEFFGKLKGIG